MHRKHLLITLLAIAVFLNPAFQAFALVNYESGRMEINGILLLQDAGDPEAYYYLPPAPRVSMKPDGALELSVVKFVDPKGETSGGLFHMLVTFSLPPDELEALQKALNMPRAENMALTLVPVTDGYVHVEPAVFDLIRSRLGTANLFPFGIGTSVNRHLIEGMAHAGMGEPFVVTKQTEAQAQGKKFREYIQSPALTRIRLNFGQFQVYDIEPPSVPDVLAERPVICFGKWRGRPAGDIEITGYAGGGKPYKQTFDVAKARASENNAALKYLWARHRIMLLQDYNKLIWT